MAKRKTRKLRKKELNITAILLNAEKYVRSHPIYRAMYRDEILAADLDRQRKNRRNKLKY